MSYSVSQVARMAGVTVRTLHHYDEIGLLRPSERTEARYRLYSEGDVDRLQEILFYRELGFSLDVIATMLDDPTVDARAHLARQRQLLIDRAGRIEAMVAAIDRSLEAQRMGYELTATEKLEVFTHLYAGKVRDVYEIDEATLLLVASDRLSAFDVVMAEAIPDKGRVLTAMTVFWLEQLSDVAPSHLITAVPGELPPEVVGKTGMAGRAMLVRRAEMLPIECIVRGYLTGSAWKEYQRSGTVHGVALPAGLKESDRLPEPVFTPSTKAATGHDENISFDHAAALVGPDVAEAARQISLQVYRRGAEWAQQRGVIIADTKLEMGWIDGELALCDEVLTPDSSRFWPAEHWEPGAAPPSFDKQPVRDWLEGTGWDKTPPPPALPAGIVAATSARYAEAYERITGLRLADWYDD